MAARGMDRREEVLAVQPAPGATLVDIEVDAVAVQDGTR